MKTSLSFLTIALTCASFIPGVYTLTATAESTSKNSTATRTALISRLQNRLPRLTADTTLRGQDLQDRRLEMSETMKRLMKHPDSEVAVPVKLNETQRNGYRIERWQSYPLENYAVNFYVLIPDGVTAENPARGAALCIPGFGQTKELLAGEEAGIFDLSGVTDSICGKAAMARYFAEKGIVAVAVDNPSFGELSDNGVNDYLNTSRLLLEEDWSYLGLTSWQDRVILNWLKQQPYLDNNHIIVSGFSLGTEPLMVLGLIDPDIYAFVYNDFLCRTRERILVMDKPDEKGNRPFPNSIEHLIPGFLTEFDFPDIVAALAPRYVICTEGGLDRDFRIIDRVFKNSENPEGFEYYHYAKYQDPANRILLNSDTVPGNLDRKEFFELVNVDSPNHYFKKEYVGPWLDRILPK